MNPKESLLQLSGRILKRTGTTFITKYWFKILLITFVLYSINQKDFSFEISMSTSTIFDETDLLAKNELKPSEIRKEGIKLSEHAFGIGNFSINTKTRKDEKANQYSEILQVEKTSNQSTLSFIFNGNPTGKYPLDTTLVNQQYATCKQYIKRFAPVAIAEKKKYGIPVSIKLAQALLESDAGNHPLSKSHNNHFGIKCFSKNCKKGHCSNFSQDGHKDFFRSYENAWTSFRGHSIFLQQDAYQNLFAIPTQDYKGWAVGLMEAGYSIHKDYGEQLIRIIEVLNLHEFDS